ncbi:hypothetical protein SNEBB_003872 [Seison nebaliae]|nr:hypothetical protein SNEBB_003872 [Seison nebaliae]
MVRDKSESSNPLSVLQVPHEGKVLLANDADWSKKKMVWIPDESEGFVKGSIVEEQSGSKTVRLELLSGQMVEVERDLLQRMNPPKFDKVEDMADLTCLNEAAVLHNLRDRYYAGLIYTYSGLFCVVVNPYRSLPIYTEQIIAAYKGKKRHERPPHIFAITDNAYRSMLQDKEDQSILCTGESGAGKTENTKKVIQYLAHVAAAPRLPNGPRMSLSNIAAVQPKISRCDTDIEYFSAGELEAQLLQANPILEAFGNAKTIKNDNSSRFGKFIRINFDNSGYISSANIETYLLEKSRCIRQAPKERTFHIFYQFLKGATAEDKTQYILENMENYRYLSNGNVVVQNINDTDEYGKTLGAMDIMGMSKEDINAIFRTVSGVLQLGNVEFRQERNTDQATLPDDIVVQKVAHLFGCQMSDWTRALLKPKIKVGREYVTKAQSKEQAEFAVEAITKAIYERLFKWVVYRINRSLDRSKRQAASFVGILDIAGFEIFEYNSFEQICINYTNEKLQQLFNHTMFILEQEEYKKEGIDWTFIDFGLDLQPTIDLIDKPMGIFALLDEECLFPKASDKTFVEKLVNAHNAHPKFIKSDFRTSVGFTVIHYAGNVDYNADMWLIKNMDPLNDNIVMLLQNSNDEFVKNIWRDAEYTHTNAAQQESPFGGSRRKGMFRTIGQLYKEQLSKLMDTLESTNPNFVRCIIPNHEKRPNKINAILVLDQLRCNGVLEGIRICRQGFPNRILFEEFRQRYELLTPHCIPKGFVDSKKAVEKMIQELELDKGLYRIGHSKIFFRAGVLAHLEEERDLKLAEIIINLQAYCRGCLARRGFNRRKNAGNAIRIIQRNGRAFLKLRNWPWWRLFTKVKPVLQVTRQEEEVQKKEEELKKAVDLQKKQEQELKEVTERMDELLQDKQQISEQLLQDEEVIAEVEDRNKRLKKSNDDMEEALIDMENRLEEEQNKQVAFQSERKKMDQNLQDLEEQLEEEEQLKQKLTIEKSQMENKLKRIENDFAVQDDQVQKMGKEKKVLEDRLTELQKRQEEEEEKVKSLNKVKHRAESMMQEQEEKINREEQRRSDLEGEIRRLQLEIQELKEQLNEKSLLIADLQGLLERKENDLNQRSNDLEDEQNGKSEALRSIKELQSKLQDVEEDLDCEKESRRKIEKDKKTLMKEVDDLRNEITENKDTNFLVANELKKMEQEKDQLKRQKEEDNDTREKQWADYKLKTKRQNDELQQQVDQLKKTKTQVEKQRQNLESDVMDLSNDMKFIQQQKNDADQKRKKTEQYLQEITAKMMESENKRNELDLKHTKLQNECDQMHANGIDADAKCSHLEKQIQDLQRQLQESGQMTNEETQIKLSVQAKLRTAENEVSQLRDQVEENEEIQRQFEKQVAELTVKCNDFKRRCESTQQLAEQSEDARRKAQKDIENGIDREQTLLEQMEKLEKTKKRLQDEVQDVNRELDQQQQAATAFEKKARNFDKILAEEKAYAERLQIEKDAIEGEARELKTKILGNEAIMNDTDLVVEELERKLRSARLEIDEIIATKDDAGKKEIELERMKKQLEIQLDDKQKQIEELEDQNIILGDANLRAEVNMTAKIAQMERLIQEAQEGNEDRSKMLMRQTRQLEDELDEEKKQKSQMNSAKKKLEMELAEYMASNEDLLKGKDEAGKLLKRQQITSRDLQRDLDEMRLNKDQISQQLREENNKNKMLEQELLNLENDKEMLERAKRSLLTDKEELQSQLDDALSQKGSIPNEEKKRLDCRINELEEELDELIDIREQDQDKMKKLHQSNEQMSNELNMEKDQKLRLENQFSALERQNRDLKARLEEAENSYRNKTKYQLQQQDEKIRTLEESLENESREKNGAQRSLRKLERKTRELTAKFDEEHQNAELYKEQSEKLLARIRVMKRHTDELEEDVNRLNQQKRKLTHEYDELSERNDSLIRENSTLKTRRNVNRGKVLDDDNSCASSNNSILYLNHEQQEALRTVVNDWEVTKRIIQRDEELDGQLRSSTGIMSTSNIPNSNSTNYLSSTLINNNNENNNNINNNNNITEKDIEVRPRRQMMINSNNVHHVDNDVMGEGDGSPSKIVNNSYHRFHDKDKDSYQYALSIDQTSSSASSSATSSTTGFHSRRLKGDIPTQKAPGSYNYIDTNDNFGRTSGVSSSNRQFALPLAGVAQNAQQRNVDQHIQKQPINRYLLNEKNEKVVIPSINSHQHSNANNNNTNENLTENDEEKSESVRDRIKKPSNFSNNRSVSGYSSRFLDNIDDDEEDDDAATDNTQSTKESSVINTGKDGDTA